MLQTLCKTVYQFLIYLNMLLTYNVAIALLRIYSREVKACVHTKLVDECSLQRYLQSQKLEENWMPLNR